MRDPLTLSRQQITAKPRWAMAVAAFAAIIVVVGAVVTWLVTTDDGPVAAGDANIEVTFTGDEASYDGPREAIAGDAEITFINETTNQPVFFQIQRFDTGSEELAANLASLPEGGTAVIPEHGGPAGLVLTRTFGPGPHPVTVTLQPGTYVFNTGLEFGGTIWRAAVIEVVSD